MKYKAIIFDVDGTLIPNSKDAVPSRKVIDAIQKAQKIIPISIATARSQPVVNHIIDCLQIVTPCIITGGAQIIDPTSKKILIEIALEKKDTKEVIAIGKQYGISFMVADAGYAKELRVTRSYIPVRPLDLFSEPIPVAKAQKFIEKISHIPTVEAHKALVWEEQEKVHLIVTRPEASKMNGVLQIAEMLKVSPKEIIGVGEGYNDFSFLMACGYKIAMGNAIDALKKIADYVAPSVEEDGVVDILEKFVLK